MTSPFFELEPEQCADCGHWRDGIADVFVYVFDEDRHLCPTCSSARHRLLRGLPVEEPNLTLEENGALEDMVHDYSDLPLFAALDGAQ